MNNMITQTKRRNANMDLIRILSMFLIILLHSVDHSGVLEAATVSSIPMQLYVRFVYMLTQVCVNCYVLLSGYFLVKSKFRLQKLVALWMEVVFYSFIIKLIFMMGIIVSILLYQASTWAHCWRMTVISFSPKGMAQGSEPRVLELMYSASSRQKSRGTSPPK